MKVRIRQLQTQAQDALLKFYTKLASGISFREIAEWNIDWINRTMPVPIQYYVQVVVIYFLLHIYFSYAIAYSVSKLAVKHCKLKGAKIVPMFPSVGGIKEKVYLCITSLVVAHWFSSLSLSSLNLHALFSWILNIRPQINIKPQLKIARTSSCHSMHSNMSFSMERVSADMSLDMTPSCEQSQSALRLARTTHDGVTFAANLAATVVDAAERSVSRDSIGSWESFDGSELVNKMEDDGEIDIDDEMEIAMKEVPIHSSNSSDEFHSALTLTPPLLSNDDVTNFDREASNSPKGDNLTSLVPNTSTDNECVNALGGIDPNPIQAQTRALPVVSDDTMPSSNSLVDDSWDDEGNASGSEA